MAGQPKRRELVARIQEIGVEHYAERVSNGELIKTFLAELGCSRLAWANALDKIPGAPELLRRAREIRAGHRADEVLETATNSTPATERRDKLLIDQLKWHAAMDNPKEYSDKSGQVNVSVSLNTLHLDALRKVNSELQAAPKLLEAEVVESNQSDSD